MPKIKIPRKSTNIDMTAMCDVAFLLLSFFILATQFKPSEALEVQTPTSVQTRVAEMEDVVMITIDPKGRVFFSVSDDNTSEKGDIIEEVNTAKNLGLTAAEMQNFKNSGSYIGVPFSQLKSYLQKKPEDWSAMAQSGQLVGIPVTDTLNNELIVWMRAAVGAFQGSTMNLLVKGDNNAKYSTFKGVIDAFKKNEQMKFKMITNPEGVPTGSELYKKNLAKKPAE
ncbi:MAG: biopolymer transporter ExbD [Chitinophagaceae bacterium]